jgi:BolA protein
MDFSAHRDNLIHKENIMTLQDTITSKLQSTFNVIELNVINESHQHAGHQPQFDGSGETHFRIQMLTPEFEGQSRVNRHRLVNAALQKEFDDDLHALALELSAPVENKRW